MASKKFFKKVSLLLKEFANNHKSREGKTSLANHSQALESVDFSRVDVEKHSAHFKKYLK